MNRSFNDALDEDAMRRLSAFFDVLAAWDEGLPVTSPRPPRSLASPDAPPAPSGTRRRGRQRQESP